jgi:hypothetical protein
MPHTTNPIASAKNIHKGWNYRKNGKSDSERKYPWQEIWLDSKTEGEIGSLQAPGNSKEDLDQVTEVCLSVEVPGSWN